jgi:hypothetical protein
MCQRFHGLNDIIFVSLKKVCFMRLTSTIINGFICSRYEKRTGQSNNPKRESEMRKAQKFYHEHRKHCIATLSFLLIVAHYVFPEYDAHVAAIVGFICVECS